MLSNEALSRDPFLLKHVRRNGPGYVSVKLLTSLRGVRRLTRDWRVSSLALRRSSHLQLNAAGTKVRRLDSLPTHLLAPPASPGAAALSGGDGDIRQTPSPPPDVCAAGLGSPGLRAGAAEGSGGSGRQSMATQCGLGDEGSSACSEPHGDDGNDDDGDGGAEGQQRAASGGGALRLGGPGAGSLAVAVVLAKDAISVGTQTPCDPSPVGRADFDYDVWVNEWPCCDRDHVYSGGYDDVCDCSDDSDGGGGDGDGGGIFEVMAYSPWVVRHRLAALRAARSGGAGAIGAGGGYGGGGGSARLSSSSSPRILRLPRGPDGTGGFAQRGAVAGHGQQPDGATAPGSAVGEAAAIYVDGDRWDLSWGPGPSSSLH
ncbi:la-related protein 6 [Lethenteron reissneri]|uniref:la-related protein 6 n=1 Tax=Lethenteron reissneri TaxID=7753 RepID=UPI002AB66399|nr:la-related protein 6 [Lethenteron reissneri]